MCHYITATLPHNANLDSIALIFEAHKLGFESISNPHVSSQIEAGDFYILTTRGNCDCGTALGSLDRPANYDEGYERELKKIRKQNWSEAKVQRWLVQKEQTKERQLREDEARAQGSTPELDQWVNFITDVLKSGHTGRIGLLLHVYQRGIASERIKILGKEKVKLAELIPQRLMRMKEDMVYEFIV